MSKAREGLLFREKEAKSFCGRCRGGFCEARSGHEGLIYQMRQSQVCLKPSARCRKLGDSTSKSFWFFFQKELLLAFALCLSGTTAYAQQTQESCVDVQVGSAQSYDCINQNLKRAAQNAQRFSSDRSAPYNANSPGNVTGQFNEAATRNRLGANFGKSVTGPVMPPR